MAQNSQTNPFEEEIHFDNSVILETEPTGRIQPNSSQRITSPKPESTRPSLTHPVATFFHCIFKILALGTYLFAYGFEGFVPIFIACVVFLTFDFWVVKNVSGRLMVGLRWWNEIKEDGSNEWIFESVEVNRLFFWEEI